MTKPLAQVSCMPVRLGARKELGIARSLDRPLYSGGHVKRTACAIVGIVVLTGCSGLDREKFALVNRAGQAVKSSTDVGVSLIKYRELVQAFATELELAQGKATNDKERALASEYASSLSTYRDALAVLDAKAGEDHGPWVPVTAEMARIATAHSLPIAKALPPAEYRVEAKTAAREFYAAKGRTPTEAEVDQMANGFAGFPIIKVTRPPVARIDLFDADNAVKALWKIGADQLEAASRSLR